MDSGPRTAFQLGNYNCVERMRASPIGVEFRAKLYRLGGVETQYAVTRLHPHLENDAKFVMRLGAAVRMQSQLEHPSIGKSNALEAGGGDRFLVADYIHGVDLKQLRSMLAERRETLSPDIAASIIADVVSAVDYAHGRTDLLADGVVHAGLSPSTVMLTAEGGVKVTGVGLLRAFQQGSWTADPGLEEFLPFLSPEVLHGEPPQFSSDVWAIGALLWELASGAPPFPNATIETLGQSYLDGPGTSPRGETALTALARRCLQPVASERFSSVSELAKALDGWLAERRPQAERDRRLLAQRLITRPRSTGIFQVVAPGEWASALTGVTAGAPAAKKGWSPPVPGKPKSEDGSDEDHAPEIETVMEIEADMEEDHVPAARPTPPPLPALPPTGKYDLRDLAAATANPQALESTGVDLAAPHPEKSAADLFAPIAVNDTDPTWRRAKNAGDLFEPIGDADPTLPKPKVRPEEDFGDVDVTVQSDKPPEMPVETAATPSVVDPLAATGAGQADPLPATVTVAPPPPSERPPAIVLHAAAAMITSSVDDIFAPSPTDDPAKLFGGAAPGVPLESTESMPSVATLAAKAVNQYTPAVVVAVEAREPLAPSLPPPPVVPLPPRISQPRAVVRPKSRVGLALALAGALVVVAGGIAFVKFSHVGDSKKPVPIEPIEEPIAKPDLPTEKKPEPPVAAIEKPVTKPTPPPVVEEHPAPIPDGGAGFSITSAPPGAQLFVDGTPRGATPQPVDLTPGRHHVVIAAPGKILWKREVDNAHGNIVATLEDAHLALGKGAGLKVRCKTPDARIFVDATDTGVACPNEHRIEVEPGAHKVSIYLLRTGHTVERDVDLKASSSSSARVYFK
jgi:serine/threonine protein kinase